MAALTNFNAAHFYSGTTCSIARRTPATGSALPPFYGPTCSLVARQQPAAGLSSTQSTTRTSRLACRASASAEAVSTRRRQWQSAALPAAVCPLPGLSQPADLPADVSLGQTQCPQGTAFHSAATVGLSFVAARTLSRPQAAPVQSREGEVLAALSRIIDPDFGMNIVDCGFVKDLAIDAGAGSVAFRLELTTPACPIKDEFERQVGRPLPPPCTPRARSRVGC